MAIKLDSCAQKWNHRYPKYITPEQDVFKTPLKENFFMNMPYAKTEILGVEEDGTKIISPGASEFMYYARSQHDKYGVGAVIEIFTNTSSTPYWRDCVGEKPIDQKRLGSELFLLPKRVQFIKNAKGDVDGAPVFSTVLVVWREKK